MTLGELKQELQALGIRQVGKMKKDSGCIIWFSSDTDIVFPFPVKNIHSIYLPSDSDGEKVNKEVVAALKRRLLPNGSE